MKISAFLLILFCVTENFILAKDQSDGLVHKKPIHKEKHSLIHHKKMHARHTKTANYKCWPQRCQIVCPIEIGSPPPAQFPGTGQPARPKPTSRLTTKTPKTPAPPTVTELPVSPASLATPATQASPASQPSSPAPTPTAATAPLRNQTGIRPSALLPQITNGLNQIFGTAVPNILGTQQRNAKTKNIHHHLAAHITHKLLKQLSLANRNGKKAFKFRQLSPLGCYVVCAEVQQVPSQGPGISAPEPEDPSTSDEEEGSEEDTYEEGEDTPIEATIRPAPPSKIHVGGVRPVGGVDFIGVDDFGPDGYPAKQPAVVIEAKKTRRKQRKQKTSE